jgi:DNA-directed RNA polymerase specialized sigma24 family protein
MSQELVDHSLDRNPGMRSATVANRSLIRYPVVSSEQHPDAAESVPHSRLFASLYGELRQLAERQLRRNAGVPVSPTTLLHEAYLGMHGRDVIFPDRERFFGYAARVMRGLIIDFIRDRRALNRGGVFHITELPTNPHRAQARLPPRSSLKRHWFKAGLP